ncbi:MAG TPA: hypothetical protein PKH86_09940 [Candidatus Fermentibacter daniensis]|nr:hypothetical protein [Candidatus Fermentibacter daniensis]
MSARWYVANEGNQPIGPLEGFRIEEGIAAGRVPLTAVVCADGASEWISLAAVREFAAAIRVAYPPPALPSPDLDALPRRRGADAGLTAATGSTWHLRYQGVDSIGPFTEQDLVKAIQTSQVHSSAWVCRVGEQTWVRIYDVPAFSNCWPQGVSAAASATQLPSESPPTSDVIVLVLVGIVVLIAAIAAESLLVFGLGVLVVLVYADAWLAGIRSDPQRSGLLNMSPLGWSIGVLLFAVLFVPLYVGRRPKLKTRPRGDVTWALVLVTAGLFLLGFLAVVGRTIVLSTHSSQPSLTPTYANYTPTAAPKPNPENACDALLRRLAATCTDDDCTLEVFKATVRESGCTGLCGAMSIKQGLDYDFVSACTRQCAAACGRP